MEQNFLMVAIEAALKAGEDIMKVYEDPSSDFQIERKADNSPLTIADKKAHERICSYLVDTPYPILSEEGKHLDYSIRKQWKTLWIVDPLDGTKEFIKKNGEFTVNIALVKNEVPILGVIYVPVKKILYFAEEQIGAYRCENMDASIKCQCLDSLISIAEKMPLVSAQHQSFVVVASRSHMNDETENFIAKLKQQHADIELASSGSSIKLCLVAEGKADVYPRFAPTMEWDTAAGHAIVKASGCEVYHTDSNKPLSYNKEDLLNPYFIVEKVR